MSKRNLLAVIRQLQACCMQEDRLIHRAPSNEHGSESVERAHLIHQEESLCGRVRALLTEMEVTVVRTPPEAMSARWVALADALERLLPAEELHLYRWAMQLHLEFVGSSR